MNSVLSHFYLKFKKKKTLKEIGNRLEVARGRGRVIGGAGWGIEKMKGDKKYNLPVIGLNQSRERNLQCVIIVNNTVLSI